MGKVTAMESTELAAEYADLPAKPVIIDQIVAANLRHWRRVAGMTQEELGERVGWSAANVSAAERSADGDRDRRRFDAHTLATLAVALGVPLIAFFLPPLDDGAGFRYTFQPGEHDASRLDMVDLMSQVVMPDRDIDFPAMNAYRERLRSAVIMYLDGTWADEVARWLGEADSKEIRADRVDQLRQRSNEMLQAAEEFKRLADSIAELDDKT